MVMIIGFKIHGGNLADGEHHFPRASLANKFIDDLV